MLQNRISFVKRPELNMNSNQIKKCLLLSKQLNPKTSKLLKTSISGLRLKVLPDNLQPEMNGFILICLISESVSILV